MEWTGCEEVEQVEGKLSGVPILKGTRMQADLVLDNYQAGLSAEEIADTYDLDLHQVEAVTFPAKRGCRKIHQPSPPSGGVPVPEP